MWQHQERFQPSLPLATEQLNLGPAVGMQMTASIVIGRMTPALGPTSTIPVGDQRHRS